jgi:outer membrane receptor protein involved in Fe transport
VLRPTVDDSVKLMAGRAFRAPSIYELTYWDGGMTQAQSPDLQPETVNSVELELAHRLADRTWLSSSLYLNQVEGLIVQQGAGDEVDPLRYVNRAQAVWTLGAEAELRHELRRGVLWAASYGLQRTRLGAIGGGEALPNSPEHTAGLKLLVPLAGRLAVAGNRVHVELGRLDRERQWTRPVLLWDLTVSGSAPQLGLEYAVGLRNLLDWHYHLPVGSDIEATTLQQPGRELFGSLSYAW